MTSPPATERSFATARSTTVNAFALYLLVHSGCQTVPQTMQTTVDNTGDFRKRAKPRERNVGRLEPADGPGKMERPDADAGSWP